MTYNFGANAQTNYTPSNVTITGGTLDGTTIGGSVPAVGTFTTPAAGNNSGLAATTAYLANAMSGIAPLTSTGGSQTLTASQYGCGILSLTGTLTSACTLILPNAGKWIVFNGTTGAFQTTVKTAAGTGVLIAQGTRNQVYADGANIQYAVDSSASMVMEWTGGSIVTNGTYYFSIYAPYAGVINSADYFTAAATSFTFSVQIGGVAVTGLTTVAVNSATQANTAATAANVFAVGQPITLVIASATSSPTNAVVSLRVTKA